MGWARKLVWMLTRRKPMDVSEEAPTDLNRCLNTLDLTAMGVGATLGFGLYVLSGEVAAQKAGPGVVLSFMIAAIASTFSALCYAEFAAKVPKSGSAYAYSYITVGEFVAFVIGWNLTLEHVIGTASLARGYSGYLGSLFASTNVTAGLKLHANDTMRDIIGSEVQNLTLAVATTTTSHLASSPSWVPGFLEGYVTHFDWLSFMLTMLVTGLLLLGVQVSSRFQITFASLNLCVACFIFICGLFKADFHNWNLSVDEIPEKAGSGGFLPFGFTGVIQGAGTCFFAFVGFDGIAATAEEVKNPRKAIPNSIIWTSGIIFVTYTCMATIQTLIWPYWDQKQAAPLPYIFEQLDMPIAKWTVLVGVLAGLSTSFVGGFLPLPRILFAMARDGVIYRVLAVVSKRFKVPIVATIVGGILIGCLASMLEIDQLADMLSIGTLAAYSLVSISVLLLRYEFQKPTNCSNPLPITYQDHEKTSLGAGQASKNNNNKGGVSRSSSGASSAPSESSLKQQNLTPLATTELGGGGAGLRQENLALALNGKLPSLASENSKNNNNGKINNRKQQVASTPNGRNNNSSDKTTTDNMTASVSASASTSSSSSSSITGQRSNSDSSDGLSLASSSSISRSLVELFIDGTNLPGNRIRRPDEQTTHISRVLILLLVIVTTLLDFALVVWGPRLYLLEPVGLLGVGSMTLLTLTLTYLLNRLPVSEPSSNSFEVPLVPTIPLFSVVINTYLMLNLSVMTWIRFAVWMAIGFFIYFTYGIFKSTGYKDSRCD